MKAEESILKSICCAYGPICTGNELKKMTPEGTKLTKCDQ